MAIKHRSKQAEKFYQFCQCRKNKQPLPVENADGSVTATVVKEKTFVSRKTAIDKTTGRLKKGYKWVKGGLIVKK